VNLPRIGTIGLLLLLCMIGSRRFKTIVNPVVIVCAPWAGMLIGQQLFGLLFPFSATAALLVCFAAVTFSLGALALSLHCDAEPATVTMRLQPRATLLWTAVGWSLVACAAANLAIFLYYGFVLGVGRLEGGGLLFYSLAEAVQSSSVGWIQRGLQTGVYVGAGLFALETVRLGRIGLRAGLFLAIVILQGWLMSNRLPTFLTVTIFGLMWILVYAHQLRRPTLRVVGRITLALGVAGTFYWYTMARRHSGQLPAFTLAVDMVTTFVGPPAAFSAHLETTHGWRWGTLSGLTIEGPLELFGLAHRGWGQFDPISPVPGLAKLETNVFSGLAMLLDDVGVAGTGALLATFGALTTILVASLYRRPSIFKTVLVANMYLLLFWLPVVLMSYYVFWSVQFLAVGLLGSLVFSSSVPKPASSYSQRLA